MCVPARQWMWLVLLAAGTVARAQTGAISALLRDPSGAPVAGARGRLVCEPPYEFAALRTIAASVPDLPAPGPVERAAVSSDRGVLRFTAEAGETMTTGSGMVTTAQGLGALLPRLHPGGATRITLQPLAQVSTPTGSESFRLFAKARLADGSLVHLPPLAGTEVRLPAGDYEIWAHSRDGWLWQRLRLSSGTRHDLAFAGSVQRLQLAPLARTFPDGWPELSLGDDEGRALLRGQARRAPLSTWLDGILTPPRVATARTAALPWPPAGDRTRRTVGHPLAADAPAGAVLFGLIEREGGRFQCVARASADEGRFAMPPAPDGDGWLLLLARGYAPRAVPWRQRPPTRPLSLSRGVPFALYARDTAGLPVSDLCVEYEPRDGEAARVVAHTDARGRATFGRATGPGVLLVSDARFRNQRLELDRIPVEPLPLTVDVGASCTARAVFADGDRQATIVVTLRDPSGELRPAERALAVQPGATFSFRGLPDDGFLVLMANAVRDGHTWSARQLVRSGGRPVVLRLRDEDPDLESGRR